MNKMRFIAVLMLVVASTSAQAMDHRSQFGVGAGLGANFAAPWASQDFRSVVGPKLPAGGAWIRYIPGTPEVGLELGYNYIGLSKMDFHAHLAVLEFISRQNPWGSFHPFYGVGFGWAHTANKYATGDAGQFDDVVAKLTAGIEFEMNDRTDVGLRIDHYSLFRDNNNQRNMHMLAPQVTLNYYFGTPAPLPPPEKPTPAASTPPPTTPAVTPPSQPAKAPETSAAKPGKKSQAAKAKKKKKKPARKKKKAAPNNPEEPTGETNQ